MNVMAFRIVMKWLYDHWILKKRF